MKKEKESHWYHWFFDLCQAIWDFFTWTVDIMKDELYIITTDEMTRLKQNALNLMDKLPEDLKDALITVEFLKQEIEKSTGVKIKGIEIKHADGGLNDKWIFEISW